MILSLNEFLGLFYVYPKIVTDVCFILVKNH